MRYFPVKNNQIINSKNASDLSNT